MNDDERQEELLDRWETLREQGQKISPEELCRECPELLDAIRERISALERIDWIGGEDTVEPSIPVPLIAELKSKLPRHYSNLRAWAKGGLGEIFLGRDDALGRDTVIKRIQPVHDTGASRQRFRQEAEITGGLQHPGIVPVYDCGVDENDQPYYAMRFIDGEDLEKAIERFHDPVHGPRSPGERSLAFQQFLRSFLTVCQAVGYAHNRGIIHRDLKPGNIMLGKYGETLVVDWGLAKSTALREEAEHVGAESLLPPSAPHVDRTAAGSVKGSVAFMSPEQAAGDQEIGPASDIYSLGATLYTLLTGRLPFAGRDVLEVIDRVKAGRCARPREVKPDVAPALEAICLKAMRLRPAERYGTALELAADVERWLADEPVSAWREPWSARTRRWLRRHRTVVTSVAATLFTAIICLSVLAVVLGLAYRREDRARNHYEALLHLLEGAFSSPDSFHHDPAKYHRDMLDKTLANLETLLADDPLEKAKLLRTIGNSYISFGVPNEALRAYKSAFDLYAEHLGSDHDDTVDAMGDLGLAYGQAGQWDRALPMLEESLRITKARKGEDDRATITLMADLGMAYLAANRADDSVKYFGEAFRHSLRCFGENDECTIFSGQVLTLARVSVGELKLEPAELEKMLKTIRKTFGDDHLCTVLCKMNLGLAYQSAGDANRALAVFKELLDRERATSGNSSLESCLVKLLYAGALGDAGRIDDAVPLYQEAIEGYRTAFGNDNNMETLVATYNLGVALHDAKQLDKAERKLKECEQLLRKYNRNDWLLSATQVALGATLRDAGRYSEAETYLIKGYDGFSKEGGSPPIMLPGSNVFGVISTLREIVQLYEKWNKPNKVAEWSEKEAVLKAARRKETSEQKPKSVRP